MTANMRVLHLIPRYYPARGGAETHMAELSQRLAAAGHQVMVATTDALSIEALWNHREARVEKMREECAGVQVARFPVRHLPLSALSYAAVRRLLWLMSRFSAPISLMTQIARVTPRVPALWKWLDTTKQRFDLVAGMGITFEPLLAAGLHFAREHDVPFVAYPLTHLGAGPLPGQDSLSAFYTMRHQVALVRSSDVAVMQTPSERKFYEGQGVPASRLPVIGPGVTPSELLGGRAESKWEKYKVKDPIVLSLGTMSYDKGTVHLVKAMQELWSRGEQWELFLAGAPSGPFRRFLAESPSSLRRRIHLLGAVSEQEKRDLLAASEVFVMPSRTDSFGIVYLEAWLYRKPVIAANTWGVKDVVSHGEDGWLVPFGDVPALAERISHVLAHPGEAKTMGIRGSKKVYQQHTWAHKYAQVEQIYLKLAG